jgi:hypothetical protein
MYRKISEKSNMSFDCCSFERVRHLIASSLAAQTSWNSVSLNIKDKSKVKSVIDGSRKPVSHSLAIVYLSTLTSSDPFQLFRLYTTPLQSKPDTPSTPTPPTPSIKILLITLFHLTLIIAPKPEKGNKRVRYRSILTPRQCKARKQGPDRYGCLLSF